MREPTLPAVDKGPPPESPPNEWTLEELFDALATEAEGAEPLLTIFQTLLESLGEDSEAYKKVRQKLVRVVEERQAMEALEALQRDPTKEERYLGGISGWLYPEPASPYHYPTPSTTHYPATTSTLTTGDDLP